MTPHSLFTVSQNASGETGPSTPGRPRRDLLPRVRSCWRGGTLLQRRLPHTTRGSHPLKINHLHSDSSSHHSSYLVLSDHPHLQLIYTHIYKPHTHTDSLRSLDLPRLSFLSVIPVFDLCVLDLGPLPVILIVFCLPRPRIVLPELCLLAACPDPLPGTRPCLCLTPAVLPCRYLTPYCLTILIKSCKWIQMLLYSCSDRTGMI